MTDRFAILFGCILAVWLIYFGLFARERKAGEPERFPLLLLTLMLAVAGTVLMWRDEADFPASLAAGLLVSGSALFGLFYNAAISRRADARKREEKRVDLRRALRAEIDDYVRELRATEAKRQPGAVDKAFAANVDFVPFVVVTRRDAVYVTVLRQIEVLDDEQVETVIRYYALHEKIIGLAVQMQGAAYAGLDAERRKSVLKSLHEMENTLVEYGDDALAALGSVRAQTRVKARRVNQQEQMKNENGAQSAPSISKTDPDHSGQEAGK